MTQLTLPIFDTPSYPMFSSPCYREDIPDIDIQVIGHMIVHDMYYPTRELYLKARNITTTHSSTRILEII